MGFDSVLEKISGDRFKRKTWLTRLGRSHMSANDTALQTLLRQQPVDIGFPGRPMVVEIFEETSSSIYNIDIYFFVSDFHYLYFFVKI